MGAVVIQQNQPVAYWSHILTELQQIDHTMEKELSIVRVLEEFCSILFGAVIFIQDNHKNLTFASFICLCILCYHLYVEEYGANILYHLGKKNVIANSFSQLLRHDVLPIPVGQNSPLSSLTSPLKALISELTLIYLSACSTYPYPMLQRTILLTTNG